MEATAPPIVERRQMSPDFQTFFESEYARLVRAVVPTTGSRGDAEEAVQEAMAKAYERWDRIGRMRSPAGYVYVTAINHHRRGRRRLARLILGRTEEEGVAAVGDPTEEMLERDALVRALRALPEGERDALLLVGWLGMDAAEAGEVLKIKPVSVRSRVHRGREALRAMKEANDD